MAGDVKAFRLNTGEFVVAKVEERIDKDAINAIDPLLFHIGQKDASTGQVKVGFMSLIPMGKPGDSCCIHKKDILFFVDEPDEVILDTFSRAKSMIDAPTDGAAPKLTLK